MEIRFNRTGEGRRGGRGQVGVNLGRIWKVGRGVKVIMGGGRHYRGGGKGGLLLIINVSQAVVQMVVGVVVDLGGDDCTHERWVVWDTRQRAPATRAPWWEESSFENTQWEKDKQTLVGGELPQSWKHIGVDGSKVLCVDPYPVHAESVTFSNWISKVKY